MGVFHPAFIGVVLVIQAGPSGGSGTAALQGIVRDGSDGRAVVGAAVTLTDVGRGAVTDSLGRYRVLGVPAGPQHVTVRAVGYRERVLHALVPATGTLSIDVALRPQPIPLVGLDVRLPPAVRGLDHEEGVPFPDRGMTLAAVRNHPLLAEPDAFLALGGGEVTLAPEAPDGLHVRGGASDQVAYVVDGVPVLDPFHVAGTFAAFNPDALARVGLRSSAPSPALPEALSGVVVAETRSPGPTWEARGGVSTTQARATVTGPLGDGGAGYLVSLRSGFPGFPAPPGEASYLAAESSDRLAKVEVPWAGGRLRMLAYDSENEVDAVATASPEPDAGTALGPLERNAFQWESVSLGGGRSRSFGFGTLDLVAWRSRVGSAARWREDPEGGAEPIGLVSDRRDRGLQAKLERAAVRGSTTVGLRVVERRTAAALDPFTSVVGSTRWDDRAVSFTAFARLQRPLGRGVDVDLGGSLTAVAGRLHPGPRLALTWRPAPGWTITTAYARLSQLAQSLRNPESVTGRIFPATLWVGSGEGRVPVASGRQVIVAAEHRPGPGVRLGLQGYARSLDGLALVAPGTGQPFASEAPAHGRGSARGVSMEASVRGRRAVAVAALGWQHVRLTHDRGSFRPTYGSRYSLETGATLFASATASARIGLTALFGRRATPMEGALEWESCNLLDRGCEFGGSPVHPPDGLGSERLPAYLRLDVGVRKHWHVRLAGRDALVGLFGTVTNLLGRGNVLTYGAHAVTGARYPVEMRPRGPLVVGLDWRF